MSKPIEVITSMQAPFIYQRRVRWADTDVAGVAYTGAFPLIGLEAIEAWFESVLGETWYSNTVDHSRGNPFVSLSFEFHSSLTPRDEVHVVLWVDKIGNSSMSFTLEGHVPPARKSFTAHFTCVFVGKPDRRPIPIPDEPRSRTTAYQEACKDHPGPGEFSL